MFRVVIVDDEPAVRRRLRSLEVWAPLGFTIVAEATDGEEAKAVCEEAKPDLLITDIRMPGLSGLELIRDLRTNSPTMKIVILSGYGDFSYAREALRFGVVDYLLKPIDESELSSVLQKVGIELKSVAVLERKVILRDAIQNRSRGSEQSSEELLGARTQSIAVAVLACEPLDENIQVEELIEVIESCSTLDTDVLVLDEDPAILTILLEFPSPEVDMAAHRTVVEEIRRRVGLLTDAEITIGTSEQCQTQSRLAEAYSVACRCLDGRFVLGYDRVIFPTDLGNYGDLWTVLAWSTAELAEAVETFNETEVVRQVSLLMEGLKDPQVSPQLRRSLVVEAALASLRLISALGGDPGSVLGGQRALLAQIDGLRSLPEIEAWLINLCSGCGRYILRLRQGRPARVSDRIKDIVGVHFREPLTLRDLGEAVYMNPVYLGQVFKNETGTTFHDYLNDVRVMASAKLLIETNTQVNIIAEEVGYATTGNYYRAFKKVFGCNPAEYRKRS